MSLPLTRGLRSEAQQTDESWGAVAVLTKLQSYTKVLPCPHPPLRGTPWCVQIHKIFPQKRCRPANWPAPSIYGRYSTATSIKSDTPVSGGAYQDAREVTIVWNARLKHWALPKFRGRLHPASPRTLFSPIFSLAREKIGPPEARQKRPRRNESLQARLLILCARFFLSKPQTKFAVWVFSMQICDNLSGA